MKSSRQRDGDLSHESSAPAGFSCGRPHCDVCGWTEVSLYPETVIAHCSCHAAFRNFSLIAHSRGEVMAHWSCMLTVLPISQGKYLIDLLFSCDIDLSPVGHGRGILTGIFCVLNEKHGNALHLFGQNARFRVSSIEKAPSLLLGKRVLKN